MTDLAISACLVPMQTHSRFTTIFLSALFSVSPLTAEEKSEPTPKEEKAPVSRDASVTIAGNKVDYTVTTGELALTNDKGDVQANIFHVSYVKKGLKDPSKRPVLFAFNGGPGSSAVWLHLGALGPRIVPTSPDGTKLLPPPVVVKENPYSILDVADLVFIDPVSTGLSRAEDKEKAGSFHGLQGDLDSVGDFIRRWVTENKRWSSPKYLLGESYGAIRASGLSSHLQSRYGMQLNGVILLSGLLDFRTLRPSEGNDLSYILYLPSLTATAHHHGILKGDRDALVKASKKFADTTYATALHKGNTLSDDQRNAIAAQLSQFTGMDKQWILNNHLRISTTKFRKELLRAQGKILGRFDARVAWEMIDSSSEYPSHDPSFSVAKGPFSTAMLDYLGRDLGWKDKRVYEILTGKVHPWKWNANNQYVNLSSKLSSALRENPELRILVQCGHTDLATPAGGILHSINHLQLPSSLRDNISVTWYEAGHMFYLNQPDLEKMRKDLVDFIQ